MNSTWLVENKVLAGFLAVVALGAAALGYLIFQAATRYGQVSAEFDQQAAELRRLNELPLYPNSENEKRLIEQQKEYATVIDELLAKLEKQEPEVEQTSPDAFKTRLVRERDAFAAKAQQARVKIPENFFLGFEDYETNLPPDDRTATLLLRQLMAINAVLEQLVKVGVTEITGVRRKPIPGESSSNAEEAQPRAQSGGMAATEQALIARYPFEVSFLASQSQSKAFLNGLPGLAHFIILRALNLENAKKEGPPREGSEGSSTVSDAGDKSRRSLILGTESISMTALLELVVFQPKEENK